MWNQAKRMAFVIGLVSAAGMAAAWAPPTDAQVDAVISKINDAGKDGDRAAMVKAKQDAAKAAASEVALGEATLAQIEKLSMARALTYPELRDPALARLAELAKDNGEAGARAAILRATMTPSAQMGGKNETVAEAIEAAVKHPAFGAALKAGKADAIFRPMSQMAPAAMMERKLLETIDPLITTDLPASTVTSLRSVLVAMVGSRAPVTEVPSALREQIRTKIAAAAKASIAAAEAEVEKADAKLKAAADDAAKKTAQQERDMAANRARFVKDTAALADGPWAKGTLVGNAAPDIKFDWVSEGGTAKSFADFKGKVVMVDFWATWCGPCKAVFPKIAQLQDRYKGHDVVILGLTSVQGYHIMGRKMATPAESRVDCKNDPAKEMGLMPEFMKDMGVNWTIAFGDKSCFNPDFGVQGIPHVAIIDAKGVVRYNGLYPNAAEEAAKIDELLKEAGLKAPEKPFEEKKSEKVSSAQ